MTRAGFTLLEMAMALVILAVLGVKVSMLVGATSSSVDREAATLVLDDQGRRILDRIAYAVMGADRRTLVPDAEDPLFTSRLAYHVSLGVVDGEVVWSAPEAIYQEEGARMRQVVWERDPEGADERRVVWSRLVRPFLQGELPNGVDDNDNGLIDEQGLSFTVLRDTVTIRLSLVRSLDGGGELTRTVETTVTCRNVFEEAW